MNKFYAIIITLFFGVSLYAQTVVTGTITDSKDGQPIPGASVKLAGKALGTTTDFDGKYTLQVSENPPFTIEVSNLGYILQSIEVTANDQVVDVVLAEAETRLEEVVVSASRTPERILESPVTVERMDVRAVKNTSSASFYNGLENLKGVDVNTSSLTFKSVNTRGFATFANTRFMQLVDGMDNSSPALNFALGNLLGMSELDVETVELLPGASSALYGANAFNGILFMTSKSPFKHQGVSSYLKTGLTVQDAAGDNNYYDVGIRAAHAFSEKFAAKASISFLKGTEWYATDYNQYEDRGAGNADNIIPTIDGQTAFNQANVYGDEVQLSETEFGDLKGLGQYLESVNVLPPGASNLLPADNVGRTGYKESDLTDYDAESMKASFALHYKPFGNDLEIIWNSKLGIGNTIYQGANRYSINNFYLQQHKIEIRNDNFFVRGYVTSEGAGNSYDMLFTGVNLNKETANEWFGTYAGAYAQGAGAILAGGGSFADVQAASPQLHAGSRQAADGLVTLKPGTPEFQAAFNRVTSNPDVLTGSKFLDNTKLYHADGNYNFHELIDFAEIQVGGSYRLYSLNSSGTIFTDFDGPIDYDEYGAYMQLQKKLVNDRLKFTGSIRYDKAQNFDGNYSPRVSVSYSLGEGKTRNLRASFQTGFRNPTTQDQYIGLDAGPAILVGSAPDNLDRYTSKPLANTGSSQLLGFPSTSVLSGRAAYENSWTLASLFAFSANPTDPTLLEVANFDYVKPERVTAYEVGYRAGFGRIMLDASAYYNKYEDFIGNKTVAVPHYGQANLSDITNLPPQLGGPIPTALIALSNSDFQPFQVYTNSKADVSSYGGSIGISGKIFDDYSFGLNYTYAKFDFDQDTDPDYEAGFNTPEHSVKVSFGNTDLFENFGFKVDARWQNEFLWESTFADALIKERTVVDAQINYRVPKLKSIFKVGGTNLGGEEYMSAPGVGSIGSMYYVSWVVNL